MTKLPEFIDVGGRTLPLIVRFPATTRRLQLRLNHKNQVVVSAPEYYSGHDVLSFIDRQQVWLEKQAMRIPEASEISDWLRENPVLSADGKSFPVRVETADRMRAGYRFENKGTEVVLFIPKAINNFEDALLQLVKFFAKDALACRLNYHAKRLNLKFERLSVRDQATRWGSCSGKRSISLNWRLILIKPEHQDYVILHELAHLTEMNHSKRFWDLLDSYDPLRPEHEASLKEITGTIMRVGR